MDDEVTALFKNHDTNERDEKGQRKRKYNHNDYFKKKHLKNYGPRTDFLSAPRIIIYMI